MIALLRALFIAVLVGAVFAVLLWVYLRSLHREALEKEWDAANPQTGGDSPARDDWITPRMQRYERSLRARLIALVVFVPTLAMLAIVYIVNTQ